ncbi:4-hydroxy-tetrahydrodipicolinate synthase [subsurface metagenome]
MFYPKGIISSLVTNFKEDGEIDEKGILKNIDFQKQAGVPGICVLGGTAEPMSLGPKTRSRIMKIAVEAAEGKMDVVVGALVGNPKEVMDDICDAQKVGAQACLVSATPFIRPSESDMETYFRELSAIGMPLILFNTPSRSGFLMSADLVEKLVSEVKQIVGIKESSRDIVLLAKIRNKCPHPFSVLQGSDALFLASLAMGGDGGILAAAAVVPEIYMHMQQYMAEGKLTAAQELYYRVMPLVDLMYRASHPAPLKIALGFRGLPSGKTKPPLYGLKTDHIERLRSVCAELLVDTGFSQLHRD